jgi:hypothetical protein
MSGSGEGEPRAGDVGAGDRPLKTIGPRHALELEQLTELVEQGPDLQRRRHA